MTSIRRLVLGTHNPGKVEEFRALLSSLDLDLIPASDLPDAPDVAETADTLTGNAKMKARAFFETTRLPSLADDTGLEVDALDGKPGVHTARFAGADATADDNKRRLLDVMEGKNDRRARFRTVIALVNDDGSVRTFEGTCEGTISTEPRGKGGFGYDPLFVPEGSHQTFAEMSPQAKNEISHRRKALNALWAFLSGEN